MPSRRCASCERPGSRRRRRRAGARGGARAGEPVRPRAQRPGALQLSLDFDAVSGGGGGRPGSPPRRRRWRHGPGDRGGVGRPAGGPRGRDRRPGRIEIADEARVAALETWLRDQGAVGVGAGRRRPAPACRPAAGARRRGCGRPHRGGGRSRVRRWRCATSSNASGTPLVGHEVKPLLVARFAEEPDARSDAGRLRHPDRGVPPQRGAAEPDDRRRRRGAAGPRSCRRPPRACRRTRRRRPRGAVGAGRPPRRWNRRSAMTSLDRLFARDRAAADPRPRPHGGRRASPSIATRWPPSTRVRGRDRAARGRDLRRRSATSSRSAARSSWSRSCSSS